MFKQILDVYKVLGIFIIGSIIGFVVETIWCTVVNKHLTFRNAGLLGPVNPIYGVAMVMFTMLFYKFRPQKTYQIFLMAAICGGAFEFICSVLQEMIWHTRSWDYSRDFMNLYGRTSLQYMIFWGIIGYVYILYIYPLISRRLEKMKVKYVKVGLIVGALIIAIDWIRYGIILL